MADAHGHKEGGGGGGSSLGFVLLFFGGIFFLWFAAQNNQDGVAGGLFKNASSSRDTASTTLPRKRAESSWSASGTLSRLTSSEPDPKPLSPAQTERKLDDVSRQIDKLKDDVETVKIWGVVSPFKERVRLSQGNARSDDPTTEYLTLSVSTNAPESVDMTGWRIDSYITGVFASIPLSTRLPRAGLVNNASPILVEPGETVILATGESPIGTSFHENTCTGYFEQHQDFSPSLRRECPRPLEEMKEYGDISATDDSCYDFISRQQSCVTVSTDKIAESDISSQCEAFAESELTYSGCVANHRYDPYFYKGSWRIFLARRNELWREEREIIRLIDREGKTVSVLEY